MSGYLNVPTASGASTPDQVGLVVGSNTLDLRAQIAPTSWLSGAYQAIVNQYTASGGSGSRYGLWIHPTGLLELDWFAGGGSPFAASTVATGFTAGTTSWVRALLTISAGTVDFYTSSDGVSWTPLGTQRTGLSTAAINTSGTAPIVRIGTDADNEHCPGEIFKTVVIIGGSTILNMDWTAAAAGSGPWVATSTETWTAIGTATVISTTPAPPSTLPQDMANRSQTLGEQIITNLLPRYSNGTFQESGWASNFSMYQTGAAAALATLAKYTASPAKRSQYVQMIQEIMANTLATNVDSQQHFLFSGTYDDIESIEGVTAIAWILNTLPASTFPAGLWAQWLAVCQTNCDYLDSRPGNSDTTYYINGNYNCHLLAAYWLTANASLSALDRAKYLDMYERAYAFLINPAASDAKWTGYGLVVDTTGSQADWSDYVAHLTETPGYVGQNPSPNFDPNYTTLTLDILSHLWIINRDARLLKLINALMNKDEPLINTTTWILNGTGGSRQNSNQGIWTGYYPVSALLASKVANRALLDDNHIRAMWDQSTFPQLLQQTTTGTYPPGLMRQLEMAIATVREAASIAGATSPATQPIPAYVAPVASATPHAAYSFVLSKSTGEDIGELIAAKARSITRTLNQPTTATITLQLGDPFAPYLFPSANPRLKVFRSPTPAEIAANPAATRKLLFYGMLPRQGFHASAKDDSVTCTFQDPRWLLTRRYALGTEVYAATDQGSILWGLINTQNGRSGGETWIRQGATTTGILRDRSFSRTLVSQLFDDMTKLIQGCDVDFAPIDGWAASGARTMGILNVYSQQGTDRPNAVFGYSPDGISNVADATLDFQDLTTLAQVTGNTSAGSAVTGNAGTPDANGAGLLETVTSDQDVSVQATVNAKAQGLVAEEGADRAIVAVSGPLPDAPQAFSDYDLGDTIRVAISRGAFNRIASPRVMGFTVTISQDGALDTSLTLADPPGAYVPPVITGGGGTSGGGSGGGALVTAPTGGNATVTNPDTSYAHTGDLVVGVAAFGSNVTADAVGSLNGLTIGTKYVLTAYVAGNAAAPVGGGTIFAIWAAQFSPGGSDALFSSNDAAHIWNATQATRQAWTQLSVTFTATRVTMACGARINTADVGVKAYTAGWAIAPA